MINIYKIINAFSFSLLLSLYSFSAVAEQIEITDVDISEIVSLSNLHSVIAARGFVIARTTQALTSTCQGLWVPPEDKHTLSILLAAKAAKMKSDIWYDPDISSPWGDSSLCLLTAIEQH